MDSTHSHSTTCLQAGFAVELRWCAVDELWVATAHAVPTQLTLWPDELDAVTFAAEGVWTAVKGATKLWLTREASLRAAAARSRLRSAGDA